MTVESSSQIGSSAPLRCQPILPRRILVVDGNISIRKLNTSVLTHSGYEVDGAADGAAGLEALRRRHYDLLITDHLMPNVTGVEMVKILRGEDATLPVIMASGAIPREELKNRPWLEIGAFLRKPYSLGELLETVNEVLSPTLGAHEQSVPRPN